ncbi:uncharacterized protein LOC141608251 [Silene latifolia]|uniref:uncharacterized protein LOC141608251 n=1 Tax=Silene latifolia TaxID=37657 RepID=UPI003D76C4B5
MQKIPEKVGRAIFNDTEFMTDINAVVWDVDLETEAFEQNWQTVIEAHDFQNEVKHAICSMGVEGLTTVGTVEYHDVRDGLKHRNFRVEFNTKTNESKCACKLFERHGIVCRHILWVWNGRQVHRIPEPYVLARWTKKSYKPIVQGENGKVIEDIDEADIKKAEMSKVWSKIYATVGVMDNYATVKQMKQLQKTLTQFRENITGPIEPKTKNQEIEDLLGITASNDIDLRPPNKAKNKVSGKRFRSSKEKAKSKPEKRKRRCGNCKKWVNHNSRTCNLSFAESPPSDDDDEEESENEEKRQLKEKKNRNYTEADMDNQFIALV